MNGSRCGRARKRYLPTNRQIPLFQAGDSADQQLSRLLDGSRLLYLLPGPDNSRQPFFIPASGARLYDLAEILGSDLEKVIWLP